MTELEQLRAENLQLREGLKTIFDLLDDGMLCRDISKDHLPGFAVMALGFVTQLKFAHEALDLKRTAHLARQWELMEQVIKQLKEECEEINAKRPRIDYPMKAMLNALDEHIAKGEE